MSKKIVLTLDDNHNVSIASEVHGQELYEIYVSLTAKIASELVNREEIKKLSESAAIDALKILNEKDTIKQ